MKKCLIWGFVLSISLLHSCLVPRKVVYMNDMVEDSLYRVQETHPLTIQKNDRLSIQISAKNPELAAPFNQGAGAYRVREDGEVAVANSAIGEKGFLVDSRGNIEFPILGTIRVEGLTLDQLKQQLKYLIEEQQLIVNPTVSVELMNMKVNVMGAINSVGVLNIPDGRLTLLDAISMSGGLKTNADPKYVTVIRETQGKRELIVNDIESKDIFDSPAYYLRQNDIVYVRPFTAESTPKEERNWRYVTTVLGLTTLVFTVLNWAK